ncbi:MAG: hypothetical protein HKN87_13840, partial [Saprospiraceae bacterium]|nr:hypothetical protein [Saprospiraceae bacterium]
MKPFFKGFATAILVCLGSFNCLSAQVNPAIQSTGSEKLRSALLFYADFDHSFDAYFSKGIGKALIEVDQYEPKITRSSGGKFGEAAAF